MKRGKITSEQLNSLFQEIIKKWRKPEWELKKQELFEESESALNFLEDATKEVDISSFFPLPSLHDIIERRIPIQLKKIEKEPAWNPEENEKIEEVVIAVKKVLTEDEYKEKVKGMQGNIDYPYVSYAVDRKVKKEIFASEQPGYRAATGKLIFPDICKKLKENGEIDLVENISLSELVKTIGLEKLNSEYGEKYNFVIVKKGENNYTIWDTSKYDAGFGVKKSNDKSEKIKNIELLRKKKSGDRKWLTKNYRLAVRPREIFTFENSEKVDGELAKLIGPPLIYTGTTGDNVKYIDIVGLVEKKNSKENPQTIYPEHGGKIKINNTINSLGTKTKSINKVGSSLKLLKINILGKKEK